MYAHTDNQHADRIEVFCTPFLGPFTQVGPLGNFDPRRDLVVYVDGDLVPVRSFFFDPAQNRYLLFMDRTINVQGVVQIVYHVPSPPFIVTLPIPVIPTPVPGVGVTPTTTTLTAGSATISPFNALVLTGVVTNGGPTPDGNVALYDNSVLMANVALNVNGRVVFVIASLTTGTHNFELDYLGTATYQISSDTTTVTVTA